MRDAGAAGEVTGAEPRVALRRRAAADVVRTVRNAVLRTGPRGDRHGWRAEDFEVVETERRSLRGGRAARRHVVLDGAARHLGRGEDHRARAARAGHHEVPAGRHRDHRLQRLRAGDVHQRARRPRLGPRAGHQPAARADARPPAPRQAPQRRAGDPGDHRRRADRAPGRRRLRRLRLATDPRRRSPPPWPRSSAAPAAARRSTSSCSTTTRGWCEFMQEVGRRNGGRVFLPKPARSASTSSSDYLKSRGGRRRAG